jgi:hypothetical protein
MFKAVAQFRLSFLKCLAMLYIRCTIHASYTYDLTSRSSQQVGRLLSISWMQTHSGCEFPFPTQSNIGVLMVPT